MLDQADYGRWVNDGTCWMMLSFSLISSFTELSLSLPRRNASRSLVIAYTLRVDSARRCSNSARIVSRSSSLTLALLRASSSFFLWTATSNVNAIAFGDHKQDYCCEVSVVRVVLEDALCTVVSVKPKNRASRPKSHAVQSKRQAEIASLNTLLSLVLQRALKSLKS